MAQGRFLDDADLSERRRVSVLGSKTAILLYSGRPMLGESITINGISFTIVDHGRRRAGDQSQTLFCATQGGWVLVYIDKCSSRL